MPLIDLTETEMAIILDALDFWADNIFNEDNPDVDVANRVLDMAEEIRDHQRTRDS